LTIKGTIEARDYIVVRKAVHIRISSTYPEESRKGQDKQMMITRDGGFPVTTLREVIAGEEDKIIAEARGREEAKKETETVEDTFL